VRKSEVKVAKFFLEEILREDLEEVSKQRELSELVGSTLRLGCLKVKKNSHTSEEE